MTWIDWTLFASALVTAFGIIALIESDHFRFGMPTTGACSMCGRLRRVVTWHNGKRACMPCIQHQEDISPCP